MQDDATAVAPLCLKGCLVGARKGGPGSLGFARQRQTRSDRGTKGLERTVGAIANGVGEHDRLDSAAIGQQTDKLVATISIDLHLRTVLGQCARQCLKGTVTRDMAEAIVQQFEMIAVDDERRVSHALGERLEVTKTMFERRSISDTGELIVTGLLPECCDLIGGMTIACLASKQASAEVAASAFAMPEATAIPPPIATRTNFVVVPTTGRIRRCGMDSRPDHLPTE